MYIEYKHDINVHKYIEYRTQMLRNNFTASW